MKGEPKMDQRNSEVDLIIGNATVITCNPSQPVVPGGAVAVSGDRVVQVGPLEQLRELWPGAEFEDVGGRLIMPGMTCSHMHLYSTFARGIALDGPPAENFKQILERLWWRLDKLLTEEDVWASAAVALVQCVRCGTTTIMDHHASPNAIPGSLDVIRDAVERVGIRASLAYEVSDRDGQCIADQGIAENVRFIEECNRTPSPTIRATFGLHASFTLSDSTLAQCSEKGNALGAGFHVHTSEGVEDLVETVTTFGVPVVKRMDRFGIWNPKSLAIHCVHVNPEEMEILSRRQACVVHNPESNMGNAVGAAPVMEMLRRGVMVGLGTDGYTYDMFESIKVANALHKHVQGHPQAAWEEVPRMAFANNTSIMAKHWDAPIGVLVPGAYADMIAVDYHPPTPLTAENWYSHVLFGISGMMVNTTIVGGRVLMRNRELVTVDEEELAANSRKLAQALWSRA